MMLYGIGSTNLCHGPCLFPAGKGIFVFAYVSGFQGTRSCLVRATSRELSARQRCSHKGLQACTQRCCRARSYRIPTNTRWKWQHPALLQLLALSCLRACVPFCSCTGYASLSHSHPLSKPYGLQSNPNGLPCKQNSRPYGLDCQLFIVYNIP